MYKMSLYIKTLSGDIFPISVSLPITSTLDFYRYLHENYYPETRLYQIKVFHNEGDDLSKVKEGDTLCIIISDPYREKIISICKREKYQQMLIEWQDPSLDDDSILCNRYCHMYTLMINAYYLHSHQSGAFIDTLSSYSSFSINNCDKRYPTLSEALDSYREKINHKYSKDVFTQSISQNILNLWNIYHNSLYYIAEDRRIEILNEIKCQEDEKMKVTKKIIQKKNKWKDYDYFASYFASYSNDLTDFSL